MTDTYRATTPGEAVRRDDRERLEPYYAALADLAAPFSPALASASEEHAAAVEAFTDTQEDAERLTRAANRSEADHLAALEQAAQSGSRPPKRPDYSREREEAALSCGEARRLFAEARRAAQTLDATALAEAPALVAPVAEAVAPALERLSSAQAALSHAMAEVRALDSLLASVVTVSLMPPDSSASMGRVRLGRS